MNDKYTLPLEIRKHTVQEQIAETQKIIYRNNLENLSFIADGEKNKQEEVLINNRRLKEKLDLLWGEWEILNAETTSADSGNTAVEGTAVQPDIGRTAKGTTAPSA